jgi:hypothetical protein
VSCAPFCSTCEQPAESSSALLHTRRTACDDGVESQSMMSHPAASVTSEMAFVEPHCSNVNVQFSW